MDRHGCIDVPGDQLPIARPSLSLFANLLVLAMAAAAIGCAHQFPEYPAKPASSCSVHVLRDGVTLGIEPMFDRETSEQYFEVDMLGRGILPIYVVVENQTPGRTLLVSREQFAVVGANAAGDKNDVASSTPGAVVAWTGAVALSSVGLMVGLAMVADAENIKTNFDRKAMQSQTVSAGSATSGFVFFRIPPGDPPKQWHLRAALRDTQQASVGPIEATITNQGK